MREQKNTQLTNNTDCDIILFVCSPCLFWIYIEHVFCFPIHLSLLPIQLCEYTRYKHTYTLTHSHRPYKLFSHSHLLSLARFGHDNGLTMARHTNKNFSKKSACCCRRRRRFFFAVHSFVLLLCVCCFVSAGFLSVFRFVVLLCITAATIIYLVLHFSLLVFSSDSRSFRSPESIQFSAFICYFIGYASENLFH